MTGRKPKPAELRVLQMSSRKASKLIARQIETPGGIVEPPEYLTKSQRDDWAYAVENAPKGVLRRIDKAVLAGYIIAADTHRQAALALQTTQLLVKTPKQALPMQNPYLPILNRQYMLMLRGAAELGFTPSARARLASGSTDKPAVAEDAWEDVV